MRRGVYVFYKQSFIDKENKRASYQGSIYGAIQKFELNGCELKIETVIVDKFAGVVGLEPTGQQEDSFRYFASLTLTRDVVAGAALVDARPAQLGRNTHSVCDESTSCALPWLRVQLKRRLIHEISTVNNSLDFSGQVDQFVIPISSRAIGSQLIDVLRAIENARCH